MSDMLSILAKVFVGPVLNCITRNDALSRQTCLDLLVLLNERVQSLSAKTHLSDHLRHENLLEIEKILNKLRNAHLGLRFKNQNLRTCIDACCDRYKRYHMKRDCPSNKPHFVFVEIAQQWGFNLHPFLPSEKMFAFQEFMQLPAHKRLWIALMSTTSDKQEPLQSRKTR